jgi:hypothetical protein
MTIILLPLFCMLTFAVIGYFIPGRLPKLQMIPPFFLMALCWALQVNRGDMDVRSAVSIAELKCATGKLGGAIDRLDGSVRKLVRVVEP